MLMILLAIFNLICFAQEAPEIPVAEDSAMETTTDEPVAEEVETESPAIEEQAEEVKVDEPVTEEVEADEPVAEEVKADELVTEEVKADEPVTEEVEADEPVAEESNAYDLEKIRTLLDHHDAKVRKETVETLVAAGDVAIFEEIITRLQEGYELDTSVQATMIRALVASQNADLITKGLATFSTEAQKNANEELALALCQAANNISNLEMLVFFAHYSSVANVRNFALDSVLEKVDQDNANLLIDLLWDENVEVRHKVFQKLLSFNARSLGFNPEDDILERATGIGNWKQWWNARLLLNEFMGASEEELANVQTKIIDAGESIAPYFIDAYNKMSSYRKKALLKMFVNWRSDEVINFLKKVYYTDKENSSEALQTLVTLQRKKTDVNIQTILKDIFVTVDDVETRIRLASLLSVAQEEGAIAWIKENMKDPAKAVLIMPMLAVYNIQHSDLLVAEYLGKKESQIAFETLMKLQSWKVLADSFSLLNSEQQIAFLGVTKVAPKADALVKAFQATKDSKLQVVLLQNLSGKDAESQFNFLESILSGTYEEEVYTEAVKKLLLAQKLEKSIDLIFQKMGTLDNVSLRLAWCGLISGKVKDANFSTWNERIRQEKDDNVLAALISLGKGFSKDKILPILMIVLQEDHASNVKKEAIDLFIELDKENALLVLADAVDKSKDDEWKQIASEKLLELDPTKRAIYLQELVKSDVLVKSNLELILKYDAVLAKNKLNNIFSKAKTDEEKNMLLEVFKKQIDRNEIDTLISWMDSEKVAVHCLPFLKNITSIEGDIDTAENKVAFIEKCKAWKTLQDGSKAIIVKYLEVKNEFERQTLLSVLSKGTNIAVENLKIAYQEAKTNEDKAKLLGALAYLKDTQILLLAARDENVELRKVAYKHLYELKTEPFIHEIPYYYMAEEDLTAQIQLLSYMNADEIAVFAHTFTKYEDMTDVTSLSILADIVSKSNDKEKNSILLTIANVDVKLAEKICQILPEKLHLSDLAGLISLLENESLATIHNNIVEKIQALPYLPKEKISTKEDILAYWKENQNDINKVISFRTEIMNFVSNERQQFVPIDLARKLKETPWANEFLSELYATNLYNVKVLELLAILGNEQSKSIFEEALHSENDELHRSAVAQMGKIGYTAKDELVVKAFTHKDAVVRFYALQILAKDETTTKQLESAFKDDDSRVREEAVFAWMSRTDKNIDLVDELILDKSPEVKAMAMQLAAQTNNKKHLSLMIAGLVAPYPSVRTAAYEALKTLSGENFEYSPMEQGEKLMAGVAKWQKWFQIYSTKEEIAKLTAKFSDKDIIVENVYKSLIDLYTNAPDATVQDAILSKYLETLQDKNIDVRINMLAVFGQLGKRDFAMKLIPSMMDENVAVRQAAIQAIEKLTNEKIEIEMVEEEGAWTEKVQAWSQSWIAKENQLQKEKSMAELENATKDLLNISSLWNQEQVKLVENVIPFLYNPYSEVRAKAFETIQKYATGETFQNEGTEEDRRHDIESIQNWLEETAKKIEQDNQYLPDQIKEIYNAQGDLNTVDNCVLLQDILDQFLYTEHPSLQQAYVDMLAAKGVETYGFNVKDEKSVREAKILQMADFLYHYKEKLKVADQEGKEQLKKYAPNFELKDIDTAENIGKAKQLVSLLTHVSYPVRKKAYDTLIAIDPTITDYKPEQTEKMREEKAQLWSQWLETKFTELQDRKVALMEDMEETIEKIKEFTKINTRNEYNDVAKIVKALDSLPLPLQAEAINALELISKCEFKTDFSKWNEWLQIQNKRLEKLETIASYKALIDSPKVVFAKDVQKIETLVQCLKDDNEDVRQAAFDILSAYVSKNAVTEVREDFGYDPRAPQDVRDNTYKEWLQWYTNKVEPIATAEKTRLANVTTACETLTKSGVHSQYDVEKLGILIEGLSDIVPEIRIKSFDYLQEYAQETFGYNPNLDLAQQQGSMEAWKQWLVREEKRIQHVIEEQKVALQGLIYRNPMFNKIAQANDVENIIQGLISPEQAIKDMSFAWLQQQTKETFGYNPAENAKNNETAYTAIQEWLRVQKAIFMIQDSENLLENGVEMETDIAILNTIIEQLTDPVETIAKQAFQTLVKLSGNTTTIEQFLINKDNTKTIFKTWLQGQKDLVQIKSVTRNVTLQDISKVNELVDALFHPELVVRQYAIQAIEKLANKKFAYRAEDSEEERSQAAREIDEWYGTVKDSLD
ncbi:MAG: hypothetical protein KBC30_09340 [Planctomycetes bacterium]|nr:hypothetical protein [Planctomycetota bacterium]